MNTIANQEFFPDTGICWWSFAVRGGLAWLFAVVLFLTSSFLGIFFFDRVTLVYLSLLLGFFIVGNGLLLAVSAFFAFEHHLHFWWVVLAEGCFALLLGVYIGVSLWLTPQSLAFLAGIHGVGNGCFQCAMGMKMREDRGHLLLLGIAGLVSLAIGVAFLTHYNLAPRITTQALSGYELLEGAVWMLFAFRLRS
jgi:uncharacterized membrane protein HdeD (DUF308 family)